MKTLLLVGRIGTGLAMALLGGMAFAQGCGLVPTYADQEFYCNKTS